MFHDKDIFRNAQAIVLIIAILGFGWMYFFHDRVFSDAEPPQAEVSHEIYSACLNDEFRWLRVIVELRNTGPVSIAHSESDHYVAQVAPLSTRLGNVLRERESRALRNGSIDWPVLSHIRSPADPGGGTLEPGNRLRMHHDFIITPSARIVEVSSSFANEPSGGTNAPGRWEAKTIYDTGDEPCLQ